MHKKRLLIVYFLFLTSMLLVSVRIYIIATDGSSAQKVLSGQYSRKLEIAERSGFVFDRNGKLCGMISLGDIACREESVMDAADALTDITSGIREGE